MIKHSIGRLSDNDIVLNDVRVSRSQHCFLVENNGSYLIEDNGSTNGVFVDDVRVKELTPLSFQSKIVIGSNIYSLQDLLDRLSASLINSCKDIENKYSEIENRYNKNARMLCDSLQINDEPYQRLFSSKDEEIEYIINDYEKKADELTSMLKLISRSSQNDTLQIHDDLELLAHLSKKADEKQKSECQQIRLRVNNIIDNLQFHLYEQIDNAVSRFNDYFTALFNARRETAVAEQQVWNGKSDNQVISLPYLYYLTRKYEYRLFDKTFTFCRLCFIPFLKRNNLIIRHTNATLSEAQQMVNNIIGRLLVSSNSGNIQLHTIDTKDLGGTSNILKMLDKHVYSVIARSSDVVNMLTGMDNYVEDVVQNLLYGPYTSIESYNKGKEKQEPYHIVVFKNFPLGITPEAAHLIQRILVNGNKAGIYFVFMYNVDLVQHSDECLKIANILHPDSPQDLFAEAIEINDNDSRQSFAALSDETLYGIINQVNSGFEMKNDEVLRLTDYLIPQSEWWSRHSANRVDIPFGMTENKQIQKLNITQESGQNSAIVIGIPGSGKSVFLHVLIANAMVNYSPRELQMYLLDFSGVEFDVYARHNLPHARVIAPEAEREFGLSILNEVFEEGNRRMTLCRENGVTNIVELKQKNPDMVVPRLLVIIDEFQKIFEVENDNISREANQKIHTIIQEYRKFGINLILATQKLPAKSIVPYDLIANRVVFKSDPNDFNNLIRWSHSSSQPRLLTGTCVYNNESGAEAANYLTRSFFINASSELENLLDQVKDYALAHPEMNDEHELRTFRSEELPDFAERVLSDRHIEHYDIPREVGVYYGESIAIAPCHVYVPLTKDSNNNILIIGGEPDVAKGIAYHSILSEIAGHTEKSSNVVIINLMQEDDPMQEALHTDMFEAISEYSNIRIASSPDEVKGYLKFIKDEVINARKNDPTLAPTHFFINIFDFQRGRMFDGTGSRGDFQSECAQLLEYILRNGPMVGVFTILQVDNLTNLNRLCYSAQNLFCHRIAMQMSEQDSDKTVGSAAANKLLVFNRPATKYRGLYYNNITNRTTKFKPYRYDPIGNH